MFGPLFHKELLETSRRKRYFLARVLVGLLLLLAMSSTFVELSERSLRRQTQQWVATRSGPWGDASRPSIWNWFRWTVIDADFTTMSELALIGGELFSRWAIAVVWGIFLVTPAMMSGLIAGEKDGRTFEILLTTLLEDREILLGKTASRLFLLLVILLSGIPILAIASLFGGFDPWMVAAALAVHLCLLAFAASVSLCQSTIARKPYVAALRSYALLFFVWWLMPSAAEWLASGGRFNLGGSQGILAAMSPTTAISRITSPEDTESRSLMQMNTAMFGQGFNTLPPAGAPAAIGFAGYWFVPLAYLFASALFFCRAAAVLRLERYWAGDPWLVRVAVRAYHSSIGMLRGFIERRQRFPGFSLLWQAEVASRRYGNLDYWLGEPRNPIIIRNRTSNAYDPEKFIAFTQIVVWILSLAALVVGIVTGSFGNDFFRLQSFAMESIACVLVFLAVVLAASAFARERQYGSWESVLLTEVRPDEFLRGARQGILRALIPTFVLFAIIVVVMGLSNLRILNALMVLGAWWLSLLLALRIALCCSLFHRNITAALSSTMSAFAAMAGAGWFFGQFTNPMIFIIPASAYLMRMATGMRLIPSLAAVFIAAYSMLALRVEHALLGIVLAGVIAVVPDRPAPTRFRTWLACVALPASFFTLAAVVAAMVVNSLEPPAGLFGDGEPYIIGNVFIKRRRIMDLNNAGLFSGFEPFGVFLSFADLRWDPWRKAIDYGFFLAALLAGNWTVEAMTRRRFNVLAGRAIPPAVESGPAPATPRILG